MFDQPDLKASWTATAIVPTDWEAVSNEFPEANEERSQGDLAQIKEVAGIFKVDLNSFGDLKVIPFKQSYNIASYLYCICAGAYRYHEKNT